jgi:hypothetical protein
MLRASRHLLHGGTSSASGAIIEVVAFVGTILEAGLVEPNLASVGKIILPLLSDF